MSFHVTLFEFLLKDKNHRTNNGLTNICNVCKIDIKIGSKVCTKHSNGRTRRIYHIECAKKVNLL